MPWNDDVREEKAWLKSAAETGPTEAIRAYYRSLLGVLEEQLANVSAGMGHSHHVAGEDGPCACGHDHEAESTRAYLYGLLTDPVDMMAVGYSAYIPGLNGLYSQHLPVVKGLHDRLVVVGTPSACEKLLATSTHPRKSALKVLPFTFGHVMNLALHRTILTDTRMVLEVERLMAFSLRFRSAGVSLARPPQPLAEGLLLWGNLLQT